MTTRSAHVQVTVAVSADRDGGAQVLLTAGGRSLASAALRRAEWPHADAVRQSGRLCQAVPVLRGLASPALVEAARASVERAFAGGPAAVLTGAAPDAASAVRVKLRREAAALLAGADLRAWELPPEAAGEPRDARLLGQAQLVEVGLLEADRRRLTPLGARLAARLQGKAWLTKELLAAGVTFAAYEQGDGGPDVEWAHGRGEAGEAVYGTERMIVRAEALAEGAPQAAVCDCSMGRRWEAAVERAQREVVPVAFTEREGVGREVWFSDGAAVEAALFDHVVRGRGDVTFTARAGRAGRKAFINVYRFGERVAAVECRYGEVPAGVAAERLRRRASRSQRTFDFRDELVFALEVPGLVRVPRARRRRPTDPLRLHGAARNGDLWGVRRALLDGVALEARNAELDTALIATAGWGELRAAEYLLRLGADARARNRALATALIAAAGDGHVDLVCLIAAHLVGAGLTEALDAQDANGNTAMHWAARDGSRQIISYLRWFGARNDIPNRHGRTPAEEAEEFGQGKAAEAARAPWVAEPTHKSDAVRRIVARLKRRSPAFVEAAARLAPPRRGRGRRAGARAALPHAAATRPVAGVAPLPRRYV